MRFLVVKDEKEHPLSVLKLANDGRVKHTPLTPGLLLTYGAGTHTLNKFLDTRNPKVETPPAS